MRFLLIAFIFLFSTDAYAQTSYAGLSSIIPQRVHNKAIELETCALSCDEPERTYSREALNSLTDQFKDINFAIINSAGSTDRLMIGDALNVLSDAAILQADEIAQNGVANSTLISATQNARSNAQSAVSLTANNIKAATARKSASNGLNGEGLFLEKTTKKIYNALQSIVFKRIFSEIGSIISYTYALILTLWFVSVFVRMMFGSPVSWGSFAFTLVSFLLIQTLVFSDFSLFVSWFALPAIKTSFGLASWFVSLSEYNFDGMFLEVLDNNSLLGFLSLIEIQWARIFLVSGAFWDVFTSGGLIGFVGNLIIGAVAWAGLMVSFTYTLVMFAFQIIYSIVAMFVILAIAPLYLLFFPFPKTRGLFYTWLKAFANYLLIPVIGGLAIGLCVFSVEFLIVNMEEAIASDISPDTFSWTTYWALFIMSMINGFLATRIGSIAASLVGGGPSIDLGRDIMQSMTIVRDTTALVAGGMLAAGAFGRGAYDGVADIAEMGGMPSAEKAADGL